MPPSLTHGSHAATSRWRILRHKSCLSRLGIDVIDGRTGSASRSSQLDTEIYYWYVFGEHVGAVCTPPPPLRLPAATPATPLSSSPSPSPTTVTTHPHGCPIAGQNTHPGQLPVVLSRPVTRPVNSHPCHARAPCCSVSGRFHLKRARVIRPGRLLL